MILHRIDIHNFRRLRDCRIDIDPKETIFVGANNSGKTTVISAIRWFLAGGVFKTKDFTLKLWDDINDIGKTWAEKDELEEIDYSRDMWKDLVPYMDVWIKLEYDAETDTNDEIINLLTDLFPSVIAGTTPTIVGVRIVFEPDNINELLTDYRKAAQNAKKLLEGRENNVPVFPQNLRDFLDHESNLNHYFRLHYYRLNECDLAEDGYTNTTGKPLPQLHVNPLKDVIKIDVVSAEREFTEQGGASTGLNKLSEQLQKFYEDHLSPTNNIDANDIDLIEAMHTANQSYERNLEKGFRESLVELKDINYPNNDTPSIKIHSKLNPAEGIKHESAVQFVLNKDADNIGIDESYNGLGYRNMISMFFCLIQFRKEWLKTNKTRKTGDDDFVRPIHLVCIEEPEAHLHAQAQHVFVSQAYRILTKGTDEKDKNHRSQLLLSTHSSHVIQGVDFDHIRYFKRHKDAVLNIPISEVVNLTNTFGSDNETKEFVARYLRLTHSDMFFADGIILVEGSAERILMPVFIKRCGLDKKFVSVIEVNGSHAHRFQKLIDKLGVYSLVVTDLDATGRKPQKGKGQKTKNYTLQKWIPKKDSIDELLALDENSKIAGATRVAYQTEMKVKYKGLRAVRIIPDTFEDALAFTNQQVFIDKEIEENGIIKKFNKAFEQPTAAKCRDSLISTLYEEHGSKAELAVDMLMWWKKLEDGLETPDYIKEGLLWLKDKLSVDIH